MKKLKIKAFAKVNLFLDIVGKREDGYHCLETVMLSCGVSDTVHLEKTESGITVDCDVPDIPSDETNVAYRAAELFLKNSRMPGGVAIRIEKRIPSRAGLGGGSADAAAVLRGLQMLYGKPLSEGYLLHTAASVGADVPFCMIGGCAAMTGLGDRLVRQYPLPHLILLLARIPGGIATPEAFSVWDRLHQEENGKKSGSAFSELDNGLRCGLIPKNTIGNAFEKILPELAPETDKVLKVLRELTPCAGLSGSGNAVFGLFRKKYLAERAAQMIADRYPGAYTAVTVPREHGLEVEVLE